MKDKLDRISIGLFVLAGIAYSLSEVAFYVLFAVASLSAIVFFKTR